MNHIQSQEINHINLAFRSVLKNIVTRRSQPSEIEEAIELIEYMNLGEMGISLNNLEVELEAIYRFLSDAEQKNVLEVGSYIENIKSQLGIYTLLDYQN